MPQDLGPEADPRTVDDLITKMLQFFELQQAANGPRVPSLSSRGGQPPMMPPMPDNPHRAWGGAQQQYQSKVPLKPDGTPDYAAHARSNRTGRMPPDDVFPPEEVEGGTDTIDRNYY